MDSNLLTKYNKNVPRYTSYPTAPHFKSDFEYIKVLSNLQNLDKNEPISLYIHIPFCEVLCLYCACNTKIVSTQKPIEEYLVYLKKEIDILANNIPTKLKVNHLHFGGGTPTSLSADNFKKVFNWLTEVFDIDYSGELSIEIDPRVITDDKIDSFVSCGINRVSFGVQDFDSQVQTVINRVQPYEMVNNVVSKLRAKGITSVNFDLIYGLPCQSVETMVETIRLTKLIKPERIALYGYAHVPHIKKHQKVLENYPMPDTKERYAIFKQAKEELQNIGYKFIGIDHFVLETDSLYQAYLKDKMHRNFQGYTTDNNKTMLSVGTTAISQTHNSYMQNAHELKDYRKLLDDNKLPITKFISLEQDDIIRRDVIEKLLSYYKVDFNKIEQKYNLKASYFATELNLLEPFLKDNIVEIKNNSLIIKPECKILVRIIASYFDDYLSRVQFTHSSAV
jgi:oxygen-independent coproporphyrinogen III oxidase